MSTSCKAIALWDIPTRLFHWAIVICLPLSWLSAEFDYYDVHQWLGYTVIVLVISRIIWGFFGSLHSRFVDFLVGPRRVWSYLRSGEKSSAGHNPLGGWSVLVLLLLLLMQAISGLFNSDGIFISGPLYYAASGELRDIMGAVHELAFDALLAFVGLHILAVIYHQRWRKERLLQAMIRGSAPGHSGRMAPVPLWRALLIVSFAALALWGVLQLAPAPPSMMW